MGQQRASGLGSQGSSICTVWPGHLFTGLQSITPMLRKLEASSRKLRETAKKPQEASAKLPEAYAKLPESSVQLSEAAVKLPEASVKLLQNFHDEKMQATMHNLPKYI